jgi:hypothetical protein
VWIVSFFAAGAGVALHLLHVGAFEAEHANDGRRILTQPEHESASRIAGSVLANPLATDVLAGAPLREHEILWDFAGRACASHLDALAEGRYVVELKVTNCAEPSRFSRQALHMGYIAQCAFYAEAAKVDAAYIIAVEDKRPWPVTVLRLPREPRRLGAVRHLQLDHVAAVVVGGAVGPNRGQTAQDHAEHAMAHAAVAYGRHEERDAVTGELDATHAMARWALFVEVSR